MGDVEALKIDKTNHLLLDQPLLRLPYELLRKNFRAAHFTVEKESAAVKNLLKETATGSLNGKAGHDDVLRAMDTMLARMRGVRRKLQACADEEARQYRQVDARTAHLAELADMHTFDDVAYAEWSRCRLDRLLVDYLLRRGYNGSARALAEDKQMGDLVDIETFEQMSRIQESLRNGSVTEALAWCLENKKELRKMDSNLEFMLRYQQYIELVRTQQPAKILEAIQHAKKYLVPYREVFPIEFNHATALLCYGPDAAPELYRELWQPERWTMLSDLFTSTHNQLLGLPPSPLLHIALSSGLSALKTPACHSAHRPSTSTSTPSAATAATATPQAPSASVLGPAVAAGQDSLCPICSPELNELARSVPYAHHSKSLVESDLLLLPNHHVYGRARLLEHSRKAGLPPDKVKDLRGNETYSIDELKKVYIT